MILELQISQQKNSSVMQAFPSCQVLKMWWYHFGGWVVVLVAVLVEDQDLQLLFPHK